MQEPANAPMTLSMERRSAIMESVGDEYAMPELPYRNDQIRDRIETVVERVVRIEGRQEGHELLCANRYSQILKEMTELRSDLAESQKELQASLAKSEESQWQTNKAMMIAMAVLVFIEIGKASFPALLEAFKALH
jgi:hypothetical protein